jgi:hypothetical protein
LSFSWINNDHILLGSIAFFEFPLIIYLTKQNKNKFMDLFGPTFSMAYFLGAAKIGTEHICCFILLTMARINFISLLVSFY